MNIDEKTQEQIDRISVLAKTINKQYEFDTLSMRCFGFLNKAENEERKDTDWLKYFIIGYMFGLDQKKRWDEIEWDGIDE